MRMVDYRVALGGGFAFYCLPQPYRAMEKDRACVNGRIKAL
jgi:hypothetical protein